MRGGILLACGLGALVAGLGACKKERAQPSPPPIASVPVPDDTNDEPLRLCREVYPCRDKGPDPFGSGLCAKRATPEKITYSAPGLRVLAQTCHIRSGEMTDVVGIAPDGAHLRGMKLFSSIKGPPAERARATFDVLTPGFGSLADEAREECKVHDDGDGWLSFCSRTGSGVEACRARSDGVLACGVHAGRDIFEQCTRKTARPLSQVHEQRLALGEDAKIPTLAMRPSDVALQRNFQKSSLTVRVAAPGLEIHAGTCMFESSDPPSVLWLFWGVDPGGATVPQRELVARLDSVESRAALAASELEPDAWLLSEPKLSSGVDGRGARCEYPPGPREDAGRLTFYVARRWEALLRCDFTTADRRGACAPVTPRSRFCPWSNP